MLGVSGCSLQLLPNYLHNKNTEFHLLVGGVEGKGHYVDISNLCYVKFRCDTSASLQFLNL